MKKIFLLIIFTTLASNAQFRGMFGKNTVPNDPNFDKQKYHFGYFLVKTTTGFNVGLVANLRLHEYIDLRFEPGLYFTQRDVYFPGFDTEFKTLREVKSTYIHFPLLLKFSSMRIGNVRPYIVGGVGTALNLSSNASVTDDNKNAVFRMTKWTQFYEVGLGVDLYLEYFKFSPSIRGVFSFNDELIRDEDPNSPWTGNINSMKTRGIFINFTFH